MACAAWVANALRRHCCCRWCQSATTALTALRARGPGDTTTVATATSDPSPEQLIGNDLIREALRDVIFVLNHGNRLLHSVVLELVWDRLGPKVGVVCHLPRGIVACIATHVSPPRPCAGCLLGARLGVGLPEGNESTIELLGGMSVAFLRSSLDSLARYLLDLLRDQPHLRNQRLMVLPVLLLDNGEVLDHPINAVPDF
mmetsp:Transcript_142490/g.355152  ORF Transcript_142490/g.355152 Transcript_142490/m.355152 type:complete len:200 (+) Transcript_142490:924-1523(+)